MKAGTGALISGYDAIASGTAKSVLVCASDCRLGKPGGYQEEMYGDGAAALLLGNEGVIASVEGTYSVSYDFVDSWRVEEDKYVRQWEDRWVRDEGYARFISEAIGGLMSKYNLTPKEISKENMEWRWLPATVHLWQARNFF